MSHLLRYAYLAELFLWIPLAFFVATMPSARRWLVAPLVASVLAAAYEAYMTFVWEPKVTAPIRVDIFLVLFVACAANTISGLALVISSKGKAERTRLRVAAAVCFSVPVLSLAGLAFMGSHVARLDANLDRGRQYRFEAAFRDDATEKRIFGNIAPGASALSGYYVAGDGDDRIKHFVVNDAGRYWLYSSLLYLSTGDLDGPGASGREKMRVSLRPQSGDAYLLDVDFGLGAALAPPKTVAVRRVPPPRFPQPSSPADEVRYLGVFSATYAERDRHFFVVQAWLWESKGKVWGRYIHDDFIRGNKREFLHVEALEAKCAEACKVLTFDSGRGPRTLRRVSEDAFSGRYNSPPEEVTLRRGETMPGLFLDLAPLGSAKQNKAWLEAVLEAQMVSWDVPAK